MRLYTLAMTVLLAGASVSTQQTATSSKPGDSARVAEPAAAPAQPPDDPADRSRADSPVSLDRIREGLAKPPRGSALKNVDLKPDFVIYVEENDHIQAVLSKLETKSGPAPAGGLYGYEQQQRAFGKSDRPLQQPYAAFSGGELITLAIEGLAQKFLGGAIASGISTAQRERAEQDARREVAQAILDYCDGMPDGGRNLHLCTDVVSR